MLVIGFVTHNVLIYSKDWVLLPDKITLKSRLVENGFEYFDERMKLTDTFGSKRMNPTGVAVALELVVCDFCKEYSAVHCAIAQKSKRGIIEVLLEDRSGPIHEAWNELNSLERLKK